MIYERIEPLTPISAPTEVNRELSSMNPTNDSKLSRQSDWRGYKPSATSANPEYAFNTVITTAIMEQGWWVNRGGRKSTLLTHISSTDSGGSRESLNKTQDRVYAQVSSSHSRDRWCERYESSHGENIRTEQRGVHEVSTWKRQRPRCHLTCELQEGDNGTRESDTTYQNPMSARRSSEMTITYQ